MKTLPIILLVLALLLAVPGVLLLRQTPIVRQIAGIAFMLMATASGYTGRRLLLSPPPPSPSFILKQPDGHFQVVRPEELPAALALAKGRTVLLEFYADWCPSCIKWKQEVFSRKDVQEAMRPLVLLQIDASELTPATQATLAQYQLPGLPAILIFDSNGIEQKELRLLGEMQPEEFKSWIRSRLQPLRS
ncbi:MAG TPA: hypothetical protein DF427_13050 [Moraxellaceae bacterium]|nr:hypothetical protein [Moraxellaceae bacterium]